MKEHNPYITQLFRKYLDGNYSEEELDQLLDYFGLDENSSQLKSLIHQQFVNDIPDGVDNNVVQEIVADSKIYVMKAINPSQKSKPFKWWYVAASIAIIFSIATITYISIKGEKQTNQMVSKFGDDVSPGGNRAFVTFSNGEQITLDSNQSILKTIDGKLLYENGSELPSNSASEIATVHTPVGGEYQLILPDGTKAWLNASSSIKYPTRFTEKERSIEVQGEVYLEVANDKNKPFIVQSEQQRIKVLGTAFNIRNYTGNAITTLVHGKIALENKVTKEKVILMPGEQSTLSAQSIKVSKVDPMDYLDWKDGSFTI